MPLQKPELPPVRVKGGTAERLNVAAELPENLLIEKSFSKQPECKVELPEKLDAPVEAGDVIGKATWTADGETIYSADIFASENVPKRTYGFCLLALLRRLIMA